MTTALTTRRVHSQRDTWWRTRLEHLGQQCQRANRQLRPTSDLQSHSEGPKGSPHDNQGARTRISAGTDDDPDVVSVRAMARNRWIELTETNPGHSAWYIERFRSMATAGDDLEGEARFVDAMVPRRSRILDAGCGPGRVGGYLARVGHDVVGVDIDPILIDAAQQEHPGPTWLAADLAELDLPAVGIEQPFDAIVCAGNVLTFLDPATRKPVLANLAKHLRPDGRIVTGFGSGRDYTFAEFFDDIEHAGLVSDLSLASWDLRPFTTESNFLVAVMSPARQST